MNELSLSPRKLQVEVFCTAESEALKIPVISESLKFLSHKSTAYSHRVAAAVGGGCQLALELCTSYQLSKRASSLSLGAVQHSLPVRPEKAVGASPLTLVDVGVPSQHGQKPTKPHISCTFYVFFPFVMPG